LIATALLTQQQKNLLLRMPAIPGLIHVNYMQKKQALLLTTKQAKISDLQYNHPSRIRAKNKP
jgi:hypothetical protein